MSLLIAVVLLTRSSAWCAEEAIYRLADPQLKLVPIASDPKESFLGIHLDSEGRLFVGARAGLFVAEPDEKGGYGQLQALVRFPEHTWVYDITTRGNDLYVSTVSAIYRIPDAVTKRRDLKPQRIVWGIPLGHVHQCIHDLDWGPEGDLYFSTGDPLWSYGDFENRPDHWGHWTWFSGSEKVPYNGVGGVFRVHPDGSDLRVVARGNRNSIGLTFDSHWNLFTNDNDHEQRPAQYVPGRLLHVTPHAYFSWPRGWMPSKQPNRPDLLETINDHLGRYVPVGQVDYEDSFLPEKYRHALLLDRWGEHKVVYYPLEHRGASFRAEEKDLLLCKGDARPVGIAVGRGGRVFLTVCYMAANDTSPTYRSDVVMVTRADDPDAHPFAPFNPTQAPVDRLYTELSSADWSRRHVAHEVILRRAGDVLAQSVQRLAHAKSDDPALSNLIWLAARSGSADAAAKLLALAQDPSDDVRLQAIGALAGFPQLAAPDDLFIKAVGEVNPQVQLAAVDALFDRKAPVPPAVIEGPAHSGDTYLRQAATLLIAEKATLPEIGSLCDSTDARTRLAGVLAAGFRLTLPPALSDVPESLHLDNKAQEYSYTIPNFAEGAVDLRKLGPVGNYTMAAWWKNVPHSPDQEELFSLLSKRLADEDRQVRYEAAYFLNLLNDSRASQPIARVFAEFQPKALGPRRPIAEAWIVGPFPDARKMFELAHEPEEGAINLAAQYNAGKKTVTWKRVHQEGDAFAFDKLLAPGKDSSYYAYFRLDSIKTQPALLLVGSQQQVRIWQNGRRVWDNWAGRPLKRAEDRIELMLQPGGNDILVRVHSAGIAALTVDYEAAEEIHVSLPDALDSQRLAERLAQAKSAADAVEIPPEFLKTDWNAEWKKGNRERGRQLFDSLGCSKCHAITPDSPGGGGPSLADAGKRFTPAYVVESILLPSKQVSPLFRATIVRTKDGQLYYGLVTGETADTLDLRLQDTSAKTFNKSDLNARRQEDRSPMPQGLVRTPEELRDLLAFVLGDSGNSPPR